MTEQELILKCKELLQTKTTGTGSTIPMLSPLVSVFWSLTPDEKDTVKKAYRRSWADNTVYLPCLDGPDSSQETIIESINGMHSRSGLLRDFRNAWVIHFLPLDRLELRPVLDSITGSIQIGPGVTANVLLCAFCTQTGGDAQRKRVEEQVKLLSAWSEQKKTPVLILSNVTSTSVLPADLQSENYEIAALMAVCASSNQDFSFKLAGGSLIAAGYVSLKKDAESIARIVLTEMIQLYLDQKNKPITVKTAICGVGNDYNSLTEEMFDRLLLPLLPKNPSFLSALPYTDAVERLDAELSRRGLFGGRSTSAIDPILVENALASLGDVWSCCIDRYYFHPVNAWIENEGNKIIDKEMTAKLVAVDASNDELHRAAEDLRKNLDSFNVEQSYQRKPLPEFLHEYVLCMLRNRYYRVFCEKLIQILEQAAQNGGILFNRNLGELKRVLNPVGAEEAKLAYRKLLTGLLSRSDGASAVFGELTPCEQEKIPEELYRAFEGVVRLEPDRFQSDLLSELQFTADTQQVNIHEMLKEDLFRSLRIRSCGAKRERTACILMHGSYPQQSLSAQVLTVPWRDSIIRLALFDLKPDEMLY